MVIFWVFIGLLAYSNIGSSQELLPYEVNKKMEDLGVSLLYPLENNGKLDFKKVSDKSYAKEDLRIKRDKEEILLFLYPEHSMKMRFPHLEFNRLITHLASNHGDDRVFLYRLPESELVDWESEARFIVKRKVSGNQFAIGYGAYIENKGMVIAIHLHKELQADYDPIFTFDRNKF